jgi:hypothetical protein
LSARVVPYDPIRWQHCIGCFRIHKKLAASRASQNYSTFSPDRRAAVGDVKPSLAADAAALSNSLAATRQRLPVAVTLTKE